MLLSLPAEQVDLRPAFRVAEASKRFSQAFRELTTAISEEGGRAGTGKNGGKKGGKKGDKNSSKKGGSKSGKSKSSNKPNTYGSQLDNRGNTSTNIIDDNYDGFGGVVTPRGVNGSAVVNSGALGGGGRGRGRGMQMTEPAWMSEAHLQQQHLQQQRDQQLAGANGHGLLHQPPGGLQDAGLVSQGIGGGGGSGGGGKGGWDSGSSAGGATFTYDYDAPYRLVRCKGAGQKRGRSNSSGSGSNAPPEPEHEESEPESDDDEDDDDDDHDDDGDCPSPRRRSSVLGRIIWGSDLRRERESRLAAVGSPNTSPHPEGGFGDVIISCYCWRWWQWW